MGELVYYVQRLRYTEKELICLENAYYLKSVIPYLSAEICEKSIFQFIFQHYNVSVQRGDEYISIHYITDEEAALTGSKEGQATLQVEEINYLKNEQAFNYSISYYFQKELSIYFHVSNYLH
ncbi:UTRA domain-containing protein [Enterococcus cecorum]